MSAELPRRAPGEPMRCAPGFHDFESGDRWGVIIGVSKCKKCGAVSRSEDFASPADTRKETT